MNLALVAITLQDGGDHPLLEPAPGETPVWPTVVLTALFPDDTDELRLTESLAGTLASEGTQIRTYRGAGLAGRI